MFARGRSIRLITIAGIRVGADASWFVMLFVLIFLLQGPFQSTLNSSEDVAYLTTVITVLLFFVSLIIHELGHAFEARRHGVEVNRIELFLFGGVTHMSREANTPGEEFQIAAAGPLGTLLFIVVCVALDISLVGTHRLWDAIRLDGDVHITPVLLSLSYLVPINALILVFNLLPAYPLDGGRIARAVVWRVTGDQVKGTRYAAKMGQGFAVLIGALGALLLAYSGSFEGLWLMFVAYMIYQSARFALRGSDVAGRVQSVRVGDIMDHEPVLVLGTMSVEDALHERFYRYGAAWLPVVDGDGYLIGIAKRELAQQTLEAGNGGYTVGSILDPTPVSQLSIEQSRPLTEALNTEALGRLGALVVVDQELRVHGVITVDQVRRVLRTVLAPTPAA